VHWVSLSGAPPASGRSSADAPVFRELSKPECHAFLAARSVGRLAFTLHDRVDIQPINYVSDGDWIFGRTGKGAKLSTLLHHPWCAFEVDDVHELFEWTSVIVKGTFSILDPRVGSLHTYQRADHLLRTLVPGTFTPHDPVPQRDILFGIFANEMTGRTAHR
jgi:nitroimidazol reductase NimA-like FMN-containing flavoprotein (pyridoxamine 5'-phosphate oxidase superfamily)